MQDEETYSDGDVPRTIPAAIRGRGAADNPPNRFQTVWYVTDEESRSPDDPLPKTRFLADPSRSIIAYNDSPDVGFNASINPYRGCEHGCIYCYARPTHEYLGFSSGLDFETQILVKEKAPELLRRELTAETWKPQVIALSGVTDPYQPGERRFELTRRCLEVLREFRNPAGIVTKNHLVTRDLDLLSDLARYQAAVVFVSVTSLDGSLTRIMEPRTCHPERRLQAIEEISKAGVPTGVMVGPVIPGLTDHELPSILAAAARRGATHAGYIVLRLPHAVRPLFENWLAQHFPARKDKVLHRLWEMRGGHANDPRFGSRMKGVGVFAEQLRAMFAMACKKEGLARRGPQLSVKSFRRPGPRQLTFFDL